MTRIFTVFDLLLLLLSLLGKMGVASLRSQHSPLVFLVSASSVLLTVAVLLSVKCMHISRLRNPFLLDELPDQSESLYNELSRNHAPSTLASQRSALTVHYLWCRKGQFEYKHYLSLLSVVKVMRPDQIVFHYLELPAQDTRGYCTWFQEIRREVPMLALKQLQHVRYCGQDLAQRLKKGVDFPNPSGVFMTDDIAITNLSRAAVVETIHGSVCRDKRKVCASLDEAMAEFQLFLVPGSEPYSLGGGSKQVVLECPVVETYNKANSTPCVQINQRLFPSDIWFRKSRFDDFARKIAYNSEVPLKPSPSPQAVIPSIVHIARLSSAATLDPLCYSSIVSAYEGGKLEHVVLHSPSAPSGPLWQRLTDQYSVTHVPTGELHEGTAVVDSLLYGLHTLIQHGGLYATCDLIFHRDLRPLLRFPAVATVKKSEYRLTHQSLDLSVLFARPGSAFLRSFIPELKQMKETGSEREMGAVGYHTYERAPSSVLVETNLCSHQRCSLQKDACQMSSADVSPRMAYVTKMHYGDNARPASFDDIQRLTKDVRHVFPGDLAQILDQ